MGGQRYKSEFSGYTDAQIAQMIRDANIGRENRYIAKRVFIDHAPMVEVGEQLGYHRSTISRRLAYITERMRNIQS